MWVWIKKISYVTKFRITVCSIVFGCLGILGLLASIEVYKAEEKKVSLSHLTDLAARKVTWDRYSNRRKFNEGIYPRIVLDSLERDFDNYVDWVEFHKDYIDTQMSLREPIDTSIIKKPVFISSLAGSTELEDIRGRYLKDIVEYNINANALQKSYDQSKATTNIKAFAERCSAVFIVLSYLLQLLLAISSYLNEKDQFSHASTMRN